MPTISLTFAQLYTGFVGLREDEILTRHPLGKHLHYLGKRSLQMGMFSVGYALSEDQEFVLVLETINGVSQVVGQKTYWGVEQAFEYLKRYAVSNDASYRGYWIEAAGGRRLFVRIEHTPGDLPALCVSIY